MSFSESCYGQHLMLRIANIEKRESLACQEVVHAFLLELVKKIGMRVLVGPLCGEEISDCGKSGCSGVIILYESHAAIHTYSEIGEAFIDIFSCRIFDNHQVFDTLSNFFGSFNIIEKTVLERGHHWDEDLTSSIKKWAKNR